jgi:hypothetical protein
MKKVIWICIISLLLLPAFSQDASILTHILGKKTSNYVDFSYLIASELGMEVSPFEAYTYCDRFGSYAYKDNADKAITVKTVSYFLVRNYGLKGGIMWSAFRNPRYAFKELKSSGFWPSGTDPDNKLSGRDLVLAISRFYSTYPEAKLENPPAIAETPEQRNALLVEKEIAK